MDVTTLVGHLSEWLGAVAVAMLVGTSGRFQRRPLVFQFVRRELGFSFGLFALILLLAFAYVSVEPISPDKTLPRLVLAVLSLIPFALAVRLRGQPVRAAGWNGALLRPAVLLGLALGVLAMFLRGQVFTLLRGSGEARAADLLILLAACLAEETIFRGYIQQRLVSAWGAWAGVGAAAVLFALWQLPLRLGLGLSTGALLIGLGMSLVQGLVAGYLMHKSGHVAASGIYRGISTWLGLLG